jgi:hypothetical protein
MSQHDNSGYKKMGKCALYQVETAGRLNTDVQAKKWVKINMTLTVQRESVSKLTCTYTNADNGLKLPLLYVVLHGLERFVSFHHE